ncbi:MAG: hypothetical protein HON65_05365 [Rhodospirillales bacterium]|jgi:hypothetical protein|nr:hypothetical protein [Rhodospirillales bacterium]
MNSNFEHTVGVVVYRYGEEPGTLDADWALSTQGHGIIRHGKATGGPAGEYAGTYFIQYYDEMGGPDGSFELEITQVESVYQLTWYENAQPVIKGVGMLCENALVVGWSHL